MIIEKIEPTEMEEVESLPNTLRGEGGFGSTGILTENSAPANSIKE